MNTDDGQTALVDVDGVRLATQTSGTSAPAVVMLSSSGGGHEQWQQLRERLGDTLCVSYGRPGLAGSDPLPPDDAKVLRPASWAAEQLRGLLNAARVPGPYILISCSIGGWIADQFAARWPEQVDGLVQIDPTFITPIPGLERVGPADDADGAGILFSWDLAGRELIANPPSTLRRTVVISKAFGTVPAHIVDQYWKPLTADEVDHGWRTCQTEWARRLHALHIAADTGGHHVHIDQPELVAAVVHAVISAARGNTDLTLTAQEVADVGGHLLT